MQENTILVIDSNPDSTANIKKIFEPAGFLVSDASDGLTGLQMARDMKPGITVINTNVLKCNAFIICRLLKFDKQYQHLQIVIVSDNVNNREKAKAVGADVFLDKTCDERCLVKVVNELIN
ncbi:PleD family two-component system response regulator [Candidatus Margulisiibacteriota bacterium]